MEKLNIVLAPQSRKKIHSNGGAMTPKDRPALPARSRAYDSFAPAALWKGTLAAQAGKMVTQ
ncbi:MAG: hypothetical protein OSA97_10535 [Nevskia sp.]|nr:hypothetical protein [Nevskia sp.]